MSYLLRLDPDLYARIKAQAEKNHRSVNAEMVYRLERSIRADERKAERER